LDKNPRNFNPALAEDSTRAMVAGLANTAEYCHPCQSKEPTHSNRFNHGTDSISWRSTSAHFSHGRRRTIDIAAIYQVAFSVDASIPETKQQGEKDCRSSLCTTNWLIDKGKEIEKPEPRTPQQQQQQQASSLIEPPTSPLH
jgi:hypothetical protein